MIVWIFFIKKIDVFLKGVLKDFYNILRIKQWSKRARVAPNSVFDIILVHWPSHLMEINL